MKKSYLIQISNTGSLLRYLDFLYLSGPMKKIFFVLINLLVELLPLLVCYEGEPH